MERALCAQQQAPETGFTQDTTTVDPRAALRAVRGGLVYLELPPSDSHVHERDCKWPHDVDANLARAVRCRTTHSIANARLYGDLSLRSSGFQLFGGGDGVPMAPPSQHSGDPLRLQHASHPSNPPSNLAAIHTRRAMMRHVRDVEAFVLATLQDSRNFRLASGERVHSVAAYNHVVRCSGEREKRPRGASTQPSPSANATSKSVQSARQAARQPGGAAPAKERPSHPAGDHVINEVHSDFTTASGPAVLRHLLCDGGTPRTYGGAAGRAMAGADGMPPHRGSRAEIEASPTADEILSGAGAAADGAEGDSWRYVFINVWQSMDREQPVREAPLALLHPRSWSLEGRAHVVKLKTHAIFPENYALRCKAGPAPALIVAAAAAAAAPAAAATERPRPLEGSKACGGEAGEEHPYSGHEWVHYPEMTADEALVFVNFDSDSTQPQFVMHGAVIEDGSAPDSKSETGAPHSEVGDAEEKVAFQGDELRMPRRRISVEVRLLVLIRREGRVGGSRDEVRVEGEGQVQG